MTEGLTPQSNADINAAIGGLLREFVAIRDQVHRFRASLGGMNLTTAPFTFTPAQAADLTSAINGLDTILQAVDMTFINRLVGLF